MKNYSKILTELHNYAEKCKEETSMNSADVTLVESAAKCIEELHEKYSKLHERYEVGVRAYPTEDDIIECPYCGFDIAAVDDFDEDKPNHCPECGTRLIY